MANPWDTVSVGSQTTTAAPRITAAATHNPWDSIQLPKTGPLASSSGIAAVGRGLGSALGTIGNAFDLPLAYTEAGLAELGGAHGRIGQVNRDLAEGGGWRNIPGALSNVAENDIYFRKGSLQRVLDDPSATKPQKDAAQYLLDHPWVAGAADFATEFANPGNIVGGRLIGIGAKTLHTLAKDAPIIGGGVRAAGDALKATFDKYHPLAQAGGEEARQAGRLAQTAVSNARLDNHQIAERIFGNPGKFGLGGTTRDEQDEILRRATGGAPLKPATSSGLTDAELTARANEFRKVVDEADAVQRSRGMLDQMHENYFNMRGAYEVPENARQVAMGATGGPSVASSMRWRPPTTYAKKFDTFDEVLQAQRAGRIKLREDFSPYQQLVSHLNRVSGNVALDDFIDNLTKTDAAREVAFGGGTGEQALSAAKGSALKQARRLAAGRAMNEIAQQFGITPQEVAQIANRRFAEARGLGGRLSEVQKQGPKVVAAVKRAAGVTSDPNTFTPTVARQVAGITGKIAARGDELATKLADPQRPIAAAYRNLRDKMTSEFMSPDGTGKTAVWGKLRDSITPEGYLQVKNVPGLSGLDRLKYTDLKPEVLKYLQEWRAPEAEANGLAKFLDRYNSLFRIGILTNPLIHPGYNLLWAYLGGGGDVRRLGNFFRDMPYDAEAARYGAHAGFSPYTFGGNANRIVQSFQDATREAGGLLTPKGAAAAADWATSRAAELNRKLVFDTMERRMATEYWASLVAKGMGKAQAGEAVRKAFGDYDNLTNAEKNISRALFFYPWTKAVIPFWTKTLATRPEWVNAPGQALLTHNENAGDPNIGKEKFGTLYTGTDAQGSPQYQTLPLPQRRIENLFETALPRVGGQVDPQGGLVERLSPIVNEAQYHLKPGLNFAAGGIEQQFKEPQEPGVTPAANVVYDKDAPLSTQIAQAARYAAENAIPFSGLVQGIAHAGSEALAGAPGRAAQMAAGGFAYGEANPQKQRALNHLFDGFQRYYNAARHIPDPALRHERQDALYEQFRRQVDAVLKT